MLNYKIYGLFIPGEQIRYIGYTKNTLKRRLNGHKCKAKEINKITNDFSRKNHKDNWIRKNNFNIEIILIEDNIHSYDEVLQREKYWIKKYRDDNFDLLNSTDGGEGTVNRRLTDEQKEHLRQINKGKKLSEEHKQKIGLSNKGNKISENTINALKTYERTAEIRYKMSVGKIKSNLKKSGYNVDNLTDNEILKLKQTINQQKHG